MPMGGLLDGPLLPVAVALVFIGAAAFIFLRDQSGDLRSMLAAAPSPANSLKTARAIARMYGDQLAQCIDYGLKQPRLRLHQGQRDGCAAQLSKLAKLGPSDTQLAHSLERMLDDVLALTALVADAGLLRKTAFSSQDPGHEEALELLWGTLQPSRLRQGGRISKDWGDIGFQGVDPATDFRGMGYLSLLNLLNLAQHRPAFCEQHIRTYMQPGNELTYFPFAITSINVTGWALDLLAEGACDAAILDGRGINVDAIHAIHYALFRHFVHTWQTERPASVMEFGRVQSKALADVKRMGVEKLLSLYN
ncbi:ELMO/CED-12 family-domain-containing protein [Pavlovales sp. CCMP2436]|nr:ELMO/CED-12 family-domain-containing protein [Pavlovales sp. CCMP2436]